jgi:DNA-binding NtrC family response regulator
LETFERTRSTLSDHHTRSSSRREASQLFLVVECDRPWAGSSRHILEDIDEVVIGRGSKRAVQRFVEHNVRKLGLQVPDLRLSTTHARIRREGARYVFEDARSKNGSLVNGRDCDQVSLQDGDLIECGRTFFRFRIGAVAPESDSPDMDSSQLPATDVGVSTLMPSLAAQFRELTQIARSQRPLLIIGPTGTGKELIARAVHSLSTRTGAFAAVNCGALSENLVQAELFGARKGAFTGAAEDRLGLVRASDRGTLFLDEIGDLPSRSQPAFLRVLQEREVLAVGSTRPIQVDLRVVAATHRNLDELVSNGEFRADLLARLSGHTIRLPSLSHRIDELGFLIATILDRHADPEHKQPTISVEAMRALLRHPWPLNIRELEHCICSAITLSPKRIEIEHLPPALRSENKGMARPTSLPAPPALAAAVLRRTRPLAPEELTRREELVALLKRHGGNISEVARQMNKERVQIRRWIKLYGIVEDEIEGGGE